MPLVLLKFGLITHVSATLAYLGMTGFGSTAAPEQREEGNASTEGLAVTPGQSRPPLHKSNHVCLQPQSKRITSGGGDEGADCIPNELTSFTFFLFLTKASIKKKND